MEPVEKLACESLSRSALSSVTPIARGFVKDGQSVRGLGSRSSLESRTEELELISEAV